MSAAAKLAAMKAAKSMGSPMSQIIEDMKDEPQKTDTFRHGVKTQIVRMIENTLDNEPNKTAWDMADDAMKIIFEAYMVDKTHDFLHDACELLADYVDADHNGISFVPNDAMTLTITAETILRHIKCPHMAKLRGAS